jgi:hypothetical protein
MRVFLLSVVFALILIPSALAQSGSVTLANFPRYQTALTAEQDAQLQQFALAVTGALLTGATVEVSIYGHADFDAQGRDFEIEVSQQRAQFARQALEAKLQQQLQFGILNSGQLARLTIRETTGLGTLRPVIVQPQNEDDRRLNRRVEFVWSVSGVPQLPAVNATARCRAVLQNGQPPGPVRRMTCACDKLAVGASDTHYDFSARQSIPGSAGMPNLNPEQWHAAMSLLIRHLGRDVNASSNASATDQEFSTALMTLDDTVGRNIDSFARAAAPDLVPGLFDRVVLADIRARMADPNHIYSCYAGYSRANHDF